MAGKGPSRDDVLRAIQRCAEDNGGQVPGRDRFAELTGIRESDWLGVHWVRWNDAVREAGYEPNAMQGAIPDVDLLDHLADLVHELGHFPTTAESRMRRRTHPEFPSHGAFERLGGKQERIRLLVEHCSADPARAGVVAICAPLVTGEVGGGATESVLTVGYVYLVRSGKHHKIGRSNHLGRRLYELGIQLPERAELVHAIETDDPAGIERYWHERFADRRTNGEWFKLSREDVAAFRRRTFM